MKGVFTLRVEFDVNLDREKRSGETEDKRGKRARKPADLISTVTLVEKAVKIVDTVVEWITF